MKRIPLVVLLSVLFVTPLTICTSVHAQSIDGPSWSIGWATDMDSTYIVEMDIDWDAEGEITVYVENNRMARSLNLIWTLNSVHGCRLHLMALTVFLLLRMQMRPSQSTSVLSMMMARENTIPGNTSTLTVTAEEKVGDTTASTQEIEGDVSVPKIFDLRPEVTLPEESFCRFMD